MEHCREKEKNMKLLPYYLQFEKCIISLLHSSPTASTCIAVIYVVLQGSMLQSPHPCISIAWNKLSMSSYMPRTVMAQGKATTFLSDSSVKCLEFLT